MASFKSRRAIKRTVTAMQNAQHYAEWLDAAESHDQLTGMDDWRAEDESRDYDYALIKSRLSELRRLRKKGDVSRLVFALHEGLHGNLGNMANGRLYDHSLVGTKFLLEQYIEEVATSLNYLCDTDFEGFPLGEKLKFFKRTGMSFGRSALLLSGGATLGMFHIGVLRALWLENLLPRVISGSSAGSIIAAVAGTHSDEELEKIFDPEYLYLQAWQTSGLKGVMKAGALFDGRVLQQCIRANVGDLTFEEGFELSGRIINITVSPATPNQHSRLLNFLASPNVLIRRASLASCAIPGVFPAVTLKAKDYNGKIVNYMPNAKWVDGSLRSDLPMLRLSRFHNVNHYIVSQTNPHVVPLLTDESRKGVLPLARDIVTNSSRNAIDLARHHLGGDGLIGTVHSVTNQKYRGDINVFPRYSPSKLAKIFSNPTPDDIRGYITDGERETWPQIARIRNATRISKAFEDCLQRLKARQYGEEFRSRRTTDQRRSKRR